MTDEQPKVGTVADLVRLQLEKHGIKKIMEWSEKNHPGLMEMLKMPEQADEMTDEEVIKVLPEWVRRLWDVALAIIHSSDLQQWQKKEAYQTRKLCRALAEALIERDDACNGRDLLLEETKDLFKQAEELENENTRYQQWVDDLQADMYISCVYCGHRYGPDDEVPATMADVLKEHVEQCPKHPMSALKKRAEDAERRAYRLNGEALSIFECITLGSLLCEQCGEWDRACACQVNIRDRYRRRLLEEWRTVVGKDEALKAISGEERDE